MDSDKEARPARGGSIDFTTYTVAQLRELRRTIDREAHPLDFQNLLEALAGKEAAALADSAEDGRFDVRFTFVGGFAGWIYGLLLRLPLYGSGELRFETDDVILRGWQRTWLGAPLQAEITLDSRNIRHAMQDGRWVTFELHPDNGRVRRFKCRAASNDAAASIVERLSQTADRTETAWMRLRAFDEATRLATPIVWATPLLVGINILVFLVLAFMGGTFWIIPLHLLTDAGSNLGLLTVGGQWWRLLTSLFLHAGAMHLVLNMWALWGVGRLVERLYGTWTFLFLYFCAGVAASLGSVTWTPFSNSVGASGAIFGILGACLVFLLRRDTKVPAQVVRSQGFVILAFTAFNLILGMTDGGIDNAAHVGGLIAGCLFGWILVRPLDPLARARLTTAQIAGAATVACCMLSGGFLKIHSLATTLSAPERYWLSHQWLLAEQERALRMGGEIDSHTNAGTISSSQGVASMEREILPIWRRADTRLSAETASNDREFRQFAELVADLVHQRRQAVEATIAGLKDEDRTQMLAAAEFGRYADQAIARVTRLELRAGADRPQSLSQSRPIMSLRNLFARAFWKCEISPVRILRTDIEMTETDGKAGRLAGGCLAQRALATGDYRRLDAMLHPDPRAIGDLDDGGSRLNGVINGFDDLSDELAAVSRALVRLADWRRAMPESGGPDLVEAILFRSGAWSARGSGYAKSVSPQAWALFTLRLEMAEAALHDADRGDSVSPLWYQLSIDQGVDRSARKDTLRAIFDTGATGNRDYYGLHESMLRALMPRWGGSYEEVDEFVDAMVQKSPAERGPEAYARLYSIFSRWEGDDTNLFSETRAQWPRMKQGYEDLLRRYPKSQWLRNSYAFFACRASDAATYRVARKAIDAHLIEDAWSRKFSSQTCDTQML